MVSLICSMILATSVVTVDTGAAKCPTSPDLWGLFFEDIDLSLDGGVYAELVRNRSFEDFEGKANELALEAYSKPVLARSEITGVTDEWQTFRVTLVANDDDPQARRN